MRRLLLLLAALVSACSPSSPGTGDPQTLALWFSPAEGFPRCASLETLGEGELSYCPGVFVFKTGELTFGGPYKVSSGRIPVPVVLTYDRTATYMWVGGERLPGYPSPSDPLSPAIDPWSLFSESCQLSARRRKDDEALARCFVRPSAPPGSVSHVERSTKVWSRRKVQAFSKGPPA